MTVLPRQQEHAHSAHVCSNRSIFGFTLNLFILIIQRAVAFRAAVQRSMWVTAVLNLSKCTGLAGYKPLVCVQKAPVQNNWSTNYCLRETSALQGDGWKEPCQTPPGALSRKTHYAFISRTSASHQEKAFWCQGLALPFWEKGSLHTYSLSASSFSKQTQRGHLAQFSLLCTWHWIG